MSKPSSNPLDDLQKLATAFQKSMNPLNEMLSIIHKQLKPFQQLGIALAALSEQIDKNFIEGINSLSSPKRYDPTIKLSETVHKMALTTISNVDDIGNEPFSYLRNTLELGFNAHIQKNYHLSLFCIFSSIDGILAWYYCQNHNCTTPPTFDQKLKNFMRIYRFESTMSKSKFKTKFGIFMEHRHQIMHGGKYAHFDRNLSTIALLFFEIVYHTIKEEIK